MANFTVRHHLVWKVFVLFNSNDWEFLFDLGDSQLVFDSSRSKKAVLLVELTGRPVSKGKPICRSCATIWLVCPLFCCGSWLPWLCFTILTALNPLGYQAQLPANFEMNVVVSLTGVVMCSSSAEAVWTGLPGPWVDLSTFLKLALVPLAVLIWQLASLLVCQLPFPKLALPCPLPQQCLLCVHFCFFLWACPPSPR